MAQRTPTKWIVAGVAVAVLVAALLAAIVTILSGRSEPTATVTSSRAPSTAVTTSAVPAEPDPPEAGVQVTTETFTSGGIERTYDVIEPADLADGEQLPWVLVLHGIGVSSESMSTIADWRSAVERDRFVAVFGQGVMNSWNLGPCCPPASLMSVDDVAYIDAVVEAVGERSGVDPTRQFATGFSNGALMAYAYACERPEVFFAIAPMAGSNLSGCSPPEPVSLFHQHSDNDYVVPIGGGVGAGSLLTGQAFPPVRDSVAAWAAADGCSTTPDEGTVAEGVNSLTWTACSEGSRVELVTISGTEHNWPSRGSYDPLAAMLEFFGIS